jgi:inner membrane protein
MVTETVRSDIALKLIIHIITAGRNVIQAQVSLWIKRRTKPLLKEFVRKNKMSNGPTHIAASGLGVFACAATQEYMEKGEISWKSMVAGALAAKTARLPDIIEPAFCNPNHRQFFHSLGFAGLVGYGIYELYKWDTEDDLQECLRVAGMAIGGSYLIHLLCDAGTPKGLPFIGKI